MKISTILLGNKPVIRMEDGPVTQFLFSDVRFSWFWLILRVYLGYQWLTFGWEKIHDPNWVGANAGANLAKYVGSALSATTSSHYFVQQWYTAFLQAVVLPIAPAFSYVVAFGELLVGIALILGIFTGIAAFFAGFMNVSYLLAGFLSVNPFFFMFATWLVLAWKTAGWFGADRWVLPSLGTPWRPGKVFVEKGSPKVATQV